MGNSSSQSTPRGHDRGDRAPTLFSPWGVCLLPSTYARPSRLPRALGQSSHRVDDELGALWGIG